jgi:uroporphyrinogen-III synthase
MPTGPLSGFVVGVTADRRASEQIHLLEHQGAECLHAPVIRTRPVGQERDLEPITRALIERPPDAVLLMTGIGVRGWFEAADALHLGEELRRALQGAAVLTRGSKAAGAAVSAGLEVTWNAPTAESTALVDELHRRGGSGGRVAVQLDGAHGASVSAALACGGADVVSVPVYRWTLPTDTGPAERLVRAVCEARVDAVTFTARPAVENLLTIADELDLRRDVLDAFAGDVLAVCVGPVCAAGAAAAGIGRVVQPDRPRLGPMVQAVGAELSGRSRTLRLAGHEVAVQGRLVSVGDAEPVALTNRERDLLLALAERPGAVLSKHELLSRVWRGGEQDVHAVEVAMGRLRQRLGEAGPGIETVFRRGYRLSSE